MYDYIVEKLLFPLTCNFKGQTYEIAFIGEDKLILLLTYSIRYVSC